MITSTPGETPGCVRITGVYKLLSADRDGESSSFREPFCAFTAGQHRELHTQSDLVSKSKTVVFRPLQIAETLREPFMR